MARPRPEGQCRRSVVCDPAVHHRLRKADSRSARRHTAAAAQHGPHRLPGRAAESRPRSRTHARSTTARRAGNSWIASSTRSGSKTRDGATTGSAATSAIHRSTSSSTTTAPDRTRGIRSLRPRHCARPLRAVAFASLGQHHRRGRLGRCLDQPGPLVRAQRALQGAGVEDRLLAPWNLGTSALFLWHRGPFSTLALCC